MNPELLTKIDQVSTEMQKDKDVLKKLIDAKASIINAQEENEGKLIDGAFRAVTEVFGVWKEYIKLAEAKVETEQIIIQNSKDILEIKVGLEKARMDHEKFIERTIDIRGMMQCTINSLRPLQSMMGFVIEKGDLSVTDGTLFNRAMTVNGQIVNLLTSLHRFMEKR